MTVEAALVLPMAIGVILFVLYMLLFQYNRCLLEQDLGAMALWGSRVEFLEISDLEQMTQERIAGMYLDKYVAWEITELNASLQRNSFSVKGGAQLTFPVPGWNFWSVENVWGSRAEYSYDRLSPVTFIRLCRKLHDKFAEDT